MVGPNDFPKIPSFRLDGRLIVVTGASEGIGRELALAFSQMGARIVLAARNSEKLAAIKDTIVRRGGTALALQTDVSSLGDLSNLAHVAVELARSKDERLVLVNNAGFGYTKPALSTTEEEWDKVYDTMAKGLFFACQYHAPYMIERGYGKIVNLSSTWSKSTDFGKVVYSSVKAAVSQLTSALSTEWAPHGIRVNAIAPTATMTAFTAKAMEDNPERATRMLSRIKLGRFAVPDDLIGAALFLASEASDFVTGQTLFVDGGWNAAG